MNEILDILMYNGAAFGIELILIILISYIILTLISRISGRLMKWTKIADESQSEAWERRLKRISRILVATVGLLLLVGNLTASFLKINTLTIAWGYLSGLTLDDLRRIGVVAAQVIGVIFGALLLNWGIQKTVEFGRNRLQGVKLLQTRLDEVNALLNRLKILIRCIIIVVALLLCAYLLGVPALGLRYLRGFSYALVAFYGSLFIVQAAHLAIDVMFSLSGRFAQVENPLKYIGSLQHLAPLTKRSLEYFIYVGAATWVFSQVNPDSWMTNLGSIAIRIIAIFFISRVVIEVCTLFINEFFIPSTDDAQEITRQDQQRQTLAPLVVSLLRYAVYFAAVVMVMREAGINPTPLLAGAGILGLAFGLGAQTVIMDITSGFFILFENLFLVGDFIECADVEGYVEEIGVRITKLRDREGRLHAVPNGEIRKISSHSKDFVNAIVDVGVAYEMDIAKVVAVLETVGKHFYDEHPGILAPTRVQGVLEFGGSEIVVRTSTQVKPAMDFEVANQLRQRIKEAFDREDIEIPYARRVIIFQNRPEELEG